MTSILDVRGLTKYFGSGAARRPAIENIGFSVKEGSIVGLVGESGSGKSTTIRCTLALERPDAGSVTFLGTDISAADRASQAMLRRNVGLVFQDPYSSLDPRQTVAQIVAEPILGQARAQDIKDRSVEMLELVGLSADHLNRYPRSFSGGQRQRIAIARALIARPRLLICDEPVSALDVSIQAQVLNLLKDMRGQLGISILFIAHNLAVVRYMCDWVVVLEKGRVAEQGARDQIFGSPTSEYTRSLLDAVPRPDPASERERRRARRAQISLGDIQ